MVRLRYGPALAETASFFHEDNYARVPQQTMAWPTVPVYHPAPYALRLRAARDQDLTVEVLHLADDRIVAIGELADIVMHQRGARCRFHLGQARIRPAEADIDLAANEVYVADGYGNRRVIVFDADTAVTAYHKLRQPPFGFLLESLVGGEKWARYTFVGTAPKSAWRTEMRPTGITRYTDAIMKISPATPRR